MFVLHDLDFFSDAWGVLWEYELFFRQKNFSYQWEVSEEGKTQRTDFSIQLWPPSPFAIRNAFPYTTGECILFVRVTVLPDVMAKHLKKELTA